MIGYVSNREERQIMMRVNSFIAETNQPTQDERELDTVFVCVRCCSPGFQLWFKYLLTGMNESTNHQMVIPKCNTKKMKYFKSLYLGAWTTTLIPSNGTFCGRAASLSSSVASAASKFVGIVASCPSLSSAGTDSPPVVVAVVVSGVTRSASTYSLPSPAGSIL